MDFDWFNRDEVQRAQQFALEEHVSAITERLLFKAILLTHSKTAELIKQYLAAGFDGVLAEIDRRRKGVPATLGLPLADP